MTRDPERTRALLVAAATEEFAAVGIGGARVDRIAKAADVSKERIYGLIGNKQALFDAVLRAAMQRHVAELGVPDGDPVEYVARVHEFYRNEPALLRLLMWEALETHGTTHHPVERYRAKVEALAASQGTPPDADAATQMLILILMGMAPTLFPTLTTAILGPYSDDEGEAEDLTRRRVLDLVRPLLGQAQPEPGHR